MRYARALAALFGAAVIAAAAALTWALPANGTPPQTVREILCPDWTLRSVEKVGDLWVWGDPAAGSKVVTANKVVLTKPATALAGTEFKTDALDIDLSAATTISVDYQLSTEASAASGAVRLFYYHATNADTMNDAPDGFVAAAAGDGGTLTLSATGKVGTVGLVYDGSNDAGGSVTFTGLKVGSIAVKFAAHDKCEQPAPTPTATAVPTATATADPTPTATAPPAAGSGGGLPITGAPVAGVVAAAVLLLAAGVGLFLVARRRRVRFTA